MFYPLYKMASIFYVPNNTSVVTDSMVLGLLRDSNTNSASIASQDSRLQTIETDVSDINQVATTLSIGSTALTTTLNLGTGTEINTVNIGTGTGVSTINIGGAGDTVAVAGTLTTVNTTNLEVTDTLIRLNNGGTAGSGSGCGIEIEENAAATGYIKTNGDRTAFLCKAPAGAEFTLGAASSDFTSKTITVNDGGAVSSGAGSGILIEENGINTGKIVVDEYRSGFLLQSPSMYHATPDLYHVRISSEGIDWKNMNTASISTYYPDDATRQVKFTLDSIGGTTAGATLLTQRDYADLKLTANNASKTGMVRYETRSGNMASSANTDGEIQARDHAGARCAAFGATFSQINCSNTVCTGSLTCGSFVAGTTGLGALTSNSIDITPYTTTISGNWFRPRTTGSYTIALKRIGDIVYVNIPAIGEANGDDPTPISYFEFTTPVPVGYRPTTSSRELGYTQCTYDGTGNSKPAVIIVTNGGLLIIQASGADFTNGNLCGWAYPAQMSYRIV